MVREGVESNRSSEDARGTNYSVCDKEQDPDQFFQPNAANDIGHVSDGVAASVGVAEVALDDGAVCVQELPTQHVNGTGQGTKDEHRWRNRENTGGKDDFPEISASSSV